MRLIGPASFCALALVLGACSGGATIGGPGSLSTPAPKPSAGSAGASPTPAPGIVAGATASPGPAGATPASTGSPSSASAAYTIPPGLDADAPPLATTSSQTWGLTCSPGYVISAGGIGSCNMKWISHLQMPPTSIGAKYVPSLHTIFVSGYAHGLYAFDVSNPNAVTQTGSLNIDLGSITAPVLISAVENEDLETNGKIMFLSSREYQNLSVIDISDPANMKVVGVAQGGEGHTVNCVTYQGNSCAFIYTAYQPPSLAGHIIDVRDAASPQVVGSWNGLTKNAYAHDLEEIHPGLMDVASDPVSFLDTSDPANPKFLFSLPQSSPEPAPIGLGPPQSGHIGHSNRWPNLGLDKFFFGQDEGIYNGRCEDYPDDGRTLYSYDTTGWAASHTFKMVGSYTLVMGNGDLGLAGGAVEIDSQGQPSTAAVGFLGCATHWFDIHPNFSGGGLIAQAAFSFGARVLNVAASGQIQQVAWFVPNGTAGGDTAEAHWISDRYLALVDFDNGGLDIVEYTGPLPASGPMQGLTITPESRLRGSAPQSRAR